jgi:hypothetical protein
MAISVPKITKNIGYLKKTVNKQNLIVSQTSQENFLGKSEKQLTNII